MRLLRGAGVLALLVVFSPFSQAYNYFTCGDGGFRNYGNGHMTFTYGNNLSQDEKDQLNIAHARMTAFSNTSITVIDNGDSSYSFGNGENEIYRDPSVGTADCQPVVDAETCEVTEADMRYGNQAWTTDVQSAHRPYDLTARSITGTAVHEAGHCIGLAHSNDLYNVMGADTSHVTRNSLAAYFGPGEDASDALIQRYGKKSTDDSFRDVGATVMRYNGPSATQPEYSSHAFGRLLDIGGSELLSTDSFSGQVVYEVVPGQLVDMQFTLENNGEKDMETAIAGFYLSPNSLISNADIEITSRSYTLYRGAPDELSQLVAIPSATPPGDYFLGVYIDHDDQVPEVTSANNVGYYPIRVVSTPSVPVDLTVVSPSVGDSILDPGQGFSASAMVMNSGPGVSDTTSLTFYQSTNNIISRYLDTELDSAAVPSLASTSGQIIHATLSAPWQGGTYFIGACVDAVNLESDTTNQCSGGVQITVPVNAPDVVTLPATSVYYDRARLNARVTPNGEGATLYFDYGTTLLYGETVSKTVAAGDAADVEYSLYDLACNTSYYYRARAENSAGANIGTSASFTTGNCLSTVVLLPPTEVFGSIATLNATVNPNGTSANVTLKYGIVSTSENTIDYGDIGNGTVPVDVSITLSGLVCEQEYAYQLVAQNGGGYSSRSGAFTTGLCAASVTTDPATSVTSAGAQLNAQVNPNGRVSELYFDYGTSAAYGSTIDHGSVGGGTTVLNVSSPVTGLNCGVTYHYRARAVSSAGTSFGADQNFITQSCSGAPIVTTTPATQISSGSAKMNAAVNPNGGATTLYFDWGLTTSYGNTSNYGAVGSSNNTLNRGLTVNGLDCGQTYHYRARAVSSAGSDTGGDQMFITADCASPPSMITSPAISITGSSATLQALVVTNGDATEVYFDYGTSTAYGQVVSYGTVQDSVTTVDLDQPVSGLACDTTYHFRARGVNNGGTGFGDDRAFTTPICIDFPDVTTEHASSVTGTSAYLNATVNPNGHSTILSFDYGLDTNYGSSATWGSIGSGTTTMNRGVAAHGLSCGQKYHYRARAVNGMGTTLGIDKTFYTLECPATVTTNPATFVTSDGAQLNAAINPNGSLTTLHFDYGTSTAYGSSVSYGNIGDAETTLDLGATVTGLDCERTYQFRARGVNYGGTTNGLNRSFTTGPCGVNDCDVDGVAGTTAGDLLLLQRYLLGLTVAAPAIISSRCDIDSSGVVELPDAMQLQRQLLAP